VLRVLIFSADIGEGHDLPARVIRDALLARRPDAEVTILDALDSAGPGARFVVRNGAEFLLGRLPWLFDAEYWLLTRFPPTRWLGRRLADLLGRKGLLRTIAELRPDVVVSTYPGATDVLGGTRRRGELAVPLIAVITDLSALQYWAHPGCDAHLVIHPESAEEVRKIAGPDAVVEHVRGLTSPVFERELDPAGARAALELPARAPIVVVSGGGWGIGDLRGAVSAALMTAPGVHVVVLCGRNARVQASLEGAFAGEPRVRVMGFTDRMGDVLSAADVLVHSTAGLTVFEALVCGVRVISYGWGVGHIRNNNRAYRRFGLADVVEGAGELPGAIARDLASPRRPDAAYARLPAAADRILAFAAAGAGLEAGHWPRSAEHAAPGEHQQEPQPQ
jgi:UDP-N-acetylglucosamine:LPS N-acetylglucosamine transferase